MRDDENMSVRKRTQQNFPMLVSTLVLLLGISCLHGTEAPDPSTPSETADSPYENMRVFAQALQLIRRDFVDDSRTSYKDLTYAALRGMLAELDPHSEFLDAEAFEEMRRSTSSTFAGVGVVISIVDEIPVIVSAIEDGPAAKAGILPDDQILRINGKTIAASTHSGISKLLRGEAGAKVTLTIFRPSTQKKEDYTIVREMIKVPSVKNAQILPRRVEGEPKIGYVRILQFGDPTASELDKALTSLEEQGMKALIVDLRFNPGGLLNSAIDASGLFVPDDTLVVYTSGRNSPRQEYRTSGGSTKPRDYPVVLLVNHASASGAEIMAGALKDLGRALVVGETTFGKGSVQSIVALPDGSAIRYTSAKYFTPAGVVIHENGVEPNIRVNLTREQEEAILQRQRTREDMPFAKEEIGEDPQLARAFDLLRGVLGNEK